ncbi:hypothetical protein Tco_0127567 [Tanacetum coccineum]
MSSITAQQAKPDLELVPKEKILETGKCNERLNPRKLRREPTFQVVLDALALTPCYSSFLISADVPEVYMHQFWESVYKHDTSIDSKWSKGRESNSLWKSSEISLRSALECINLGELLLLSLTEFYPERQLVLTSFVSPEHKSFRIDNRAYKKQEKMYYPRFTKVIIRYFLTQDKAVSCRNKIGMHTSRDDYLINTLRFVSAKETTQIYGAILPESLTRATPPKKARKFKKPTSHQLTTVLVSPEEPRGKSKRVKRPAKKSTKALARGVVIRETPEMPLSKKKEKVDVTRGKRIELLSEVALTEDA